MKLKFILTLSGAMFVASSIAAPPKGYYDSLEGLCGAQLKAAVKAKIRKHTNVSYGDATWDAFRQTDVREVNGKLCWWDMYSSNNVPVSSGHPGMNIEHSVANSWWGGTKGEAYNDIFHLNPSDATANNRKNNFPLGVVVGTPSYTNGVTIVGHPASGDCGGAKNVYEPHDMYKGDFARVFFYMFTVYDNISWMTTSSDRNYMFDGTAYPSLRPWAYTMLLKWNAADPVGDKERNRCDAVYKIQKNRNPYIDIPDLCDYIWGDKKNTPFHYDPANYPDNPDPDEPDDPDPDEPGTPGTWQLVKSVNGLNASDVYILVADQANYGMSPTLNGKYLQPTAAPLAPEGDVIKSVPSDIAYITLAGSGNSYSVGISSTETGTPRYITSTSSKTVSLSENATDEGAVASISISADGLAQISYGSAGILCYNASAPRFTTYTSTGQKHLRFYRKVPQARIEGVDADMQPDLRRLVWADGGILHIPAGAALYDLWGRRLAGAPASEALELPLAHGIYVVMHPAYPALKVAL